MMVIVRARRILCNPETRWRPLCASVVRERRRRMIYGGGRRAQTNWLTTKEFKGINAIFDVLRGGNALLVENSCSTFCQSATRLSSTRRWVFSSLITFFLILKRARSPAVDGIFRDHFPKSRPYVRTPTRTRRPTDTDAKPRRVRPLHRYGKKKTLSTADLQ